jgi:histidinol-phosphate phosphatase family protein
LVVITNQSAVGRGLFDQPRLERIHRRLHELLWQQKVILDGIYYCPHTTDENCTCRKPNPGLIERAAAELGFDPREAFVIGDKACDIELGRRVGATSFLVRTGYGAIEAQRGAVRPDFIVADLAEAASILVGLVAAQQQKAARAN